MTKAPYEQISRDPAWLNKENAGGDFVSENPHLFSGTSVSTPSGWWKLERIFLLDTKPTLQT